MEVILSPELQAKLTRIARDRGTDAAAVARGAIERLVDYDEWFVREVEKGLTQIERGETLSHEEAARGFANALRTSNGAPDATSLDRGSCR